MEYLVPAWHDQLIDWSYTTPEIKFDDVVSHARVLQKGGHQISLVITDYLPQLLTQLNQFALQPDHMFSVFDYIQGIDVWGNQTVDYRDLKWPEGIIFDFTNFRLFAVLNDKLYARITFDIQGKILSVEYTDGPQKGQTFLFDSRGFVSQIKDGNIEIYLDLKGHWRIKHNIDSGHVEVNPAAPKFCDKSEYDSLKDLIEEIVTKHCLDHLNSSDHLIVTGDDQSTVSQSIYNPYHPIFSFSHWHTATKNLNELQPSTVLVNNDHEKERLADKIAGGDKAQIIPLFQSQFKLGHSQRLSQQRIAIFAEYMDPQELDEMIEMIYPRLIDNPDDTALYLFSYSPDKDGMVHQVFNKFRERHEGEFILSRNEVDPGENQLIDDLPPLLTIKAQRLMSSMDVLTALDQIRLLICWNKPDDFMSIAGVSVGIPMLQNFETAELQDGKNGMVCQNINALKHGIEYYLDTLKHWNQSLVYNVQMMNRYSEEHLLARWEKLFKGESAQ
ncbi:accessory Sec system protein Asp1 [Limosilactobacillus sp.]|uniref:accessory Sec system protein Asp1 n=1 Tax=Limosilactobacillus sp. TaxID=2773925 RepID=UPI00345E4AD0